MTGPESIASCSWEALVAELGDPFTDRPASVRRPYSPPPVPAPQPRVAAGPVTDEIPVAR